MSARRTSRWARTCATASWRCVKRCCPHDPAAARSTGWSGRYERVGGVGTKPSDLPPRRRSTAATLFLETRQSGSLSRFGGKATDDSAPRARGCSGPSGGGWDAGACLPAARSFCLVPPVDGVGLGGSVLYRPGNQDDLRARAGRPAEPPKCTRRLRVTVNHVVDLVRVDLAVAIARERLLDAVDDLRELGLVIAGNALARCSPFAFRGVVHDATMVRRQFGVREVRPLLLRGEPSSSRGVQRERGSVLSGGRRRRIRGLSSSSGSLSTLPKRASSSSPATSRSPSHSFLVAHHSELVAPSSSVMSIRFSPTAYRILCGSGSSWCCPSSRAAI